MADDEIELSVEEEFEDRFRSDRGLTDAMRKRLAKIVAMPSFDREWFFMNADAHLTDDENCDEDGEAYSRAVMEFLGWGARTFAPWPE